MQGIKIGIGFGQWKYGLRASELMCNYAEAAEAVGLDSIWLSDEIVSRNPTPDMTCMFAMSARCAAKAKADTVKPPTDSAAPGDKKEQPLAG